jgi:hypothetical protein
MRFLLPRLLLALLTLCPRLAMPADEPQQQPPQFTTSVQGSVPDLTGRWFAVANVTLAQGGSNVPISLSWEVTAANGKPNLTVRWGGLPPSMKAAIDAAASQNARWEPSAQQLQELRDGWATLAPDHPPVASVEATLIGADALTDVLKADEKMKDSLFVVQLTTNMVPGTPGVTKDVMFFGARDRLADGYGGNYVGTSIAAALVPIPIAFTGTFHLYRLGPPPPPPPARGLLERALDFFSGCGRRP